MVCGGFACSRYSLVTLNLLYIVVSIILIAVGAYSKAAAVIASINIVGGIIVCGVILLLLSLVGLVGAFKHEQVILFFYMIILFILFLVQFSIGIACLAVNTDQELKFLAKTWDSSSNNTKADIQRHLHCCGFQDNSINGSHPSCHQLICCSDSEAVCCGGSAVSVSCPCQSCYSAIEPNINKAFALSGGLGLFFSFTEILGVWLAYRYRHQRDPKANPNAFL